MVWALIFLVSVGATYWTLPPGLFRESITQDEYYLEVRNIADTTSAGFYFMIDVSGSKPKQRLVVAFMGVDASDEQPTLSAPEGLIASCGTPGENLTPLSSTIKDGRESFAISPRSPAWMICDFSSLVQRDLSGWSVTTPSVQRKGGDEDTVSDTIKDCLVKGVDVSGFSESATLTTRPVPLREPITSVTWTARTASDGDSGSCRFRQLAERYSLRPWVQDNLVPKDDAFTSVVYATELSATSLSIQEPQVVADTNVRLFLCAVFASVATSAAFNVVQVGLRPQEAADSASPPPTDPARKQDGSWWGTVIGYLVVTLTLASALRKTNRSGPRSGGSNKNNT